MAKKLAWIVILFALCVSIPRAMAMGSVEVVTKATQADLKLKYSLVAERVDSEAVLVSMEIPQQGKLKNLRSVSLHIGPGRPLVAATLQTTAGKKDSWIVAFQLSPEMADKCSIDIIVPSTGRTYVVYAVELKGYVTDRK